MSVNEWSKQKKTVIGAILICAIVIVVIIDIALWFTNDQKLQAKRSPHPVSLTIQAEGYSDQCTKIPVSIKGASFEGAGVDTVGFVDSSGQGVELSAGEYDLSFPASPLTPDGVLYNTPAISYHVSIPEDLEQGAAATCTPQEPALFTKSTALAQTSDMINSAYDYAIKNSGQASRARELKDIAVRVHNDAVNAEEERKAAEAARTIDMQYYTVKIPEYWVGKIESFQDGETLVIVPMGGPHGEPLMTVSLRSSNSQMNAGDYMGSLFEYINTPGGRAEAWRSSYASMVAEMPSRYDNGIYATLVDLQTGGQLSARQIMSANSGNPAENYQRSMSYAMQTSEWLKANVELIAK